MRMTSEDIEQLRRAFSVCRIAGIDSVVVTENMVRGMTPTTKMAIITPVKLTVDPSTKIGIGRIGEFEKRVNIFDGLIEVEAKVSDTKDVSLLTLSAGKSKIQFRCTSEKLIKYPKRNEDPELCVIRASKKELAQVAKAVKTLGAPTLTLAIGRDGGVRFECSSPTNETFITSLDEDAVFENDPQAIVHTYEGDGLAVVLDHAAREQDTVAFVLGEYGSLTLIIGGHTIIASPEANQEDDDE
jgi:hypothetical protein